MHICTHAGIYAEFAQWIQVSRPSRQKAGERPPPHHTRPHTHSRPHPRQAVSRNNVALHQRVVAEFCMLRAQVDTLRTPVRGDTLTYMQGCRWTRFYALLDHLRRCVETYIHTRTDRIHSLTHPPTHTLNHSMTRSLAHSQTVLQRARTCCRSFSRALEVTCAFSRHRALLRTLLALIREHGAHVPDCWRMPRPPTAAEFHGEGVRRHTVRGCGGTR